KWPYYPVVMPYSAHPIVNNLNAVWFQFASTIDTLNSKHNPDIRKTILLQTSPQTRISLNPARISLSMINSMKSMLGLYIAGPKNLAVLMEGPFNSNFKNRIPPEEQKGEYGEFIEKSPDTKMIVISDGDVVKN